MGRAQAFMVLEERCEESLATDATLRFRLASLHRCLFGSWYLLLQNLIGQRRSLTSADFKLRHVDLPFSQSLRSCRRDDPGLHTAANTVLAEF